MPFLDTTLAAELDHNTSSNGLYNAGVYPANFTGVTWVSQSGTTAPVNSTRYDDSFNPVSPAHVPPVSVKTLVPGFSGRWYAHLTPWFRSGGGGGHIDIGVNCNSNAWVDAALTDIAARGFDSVIIDWHGNTNYIDLVTLKIQARIVALGSPLKYSIMMDPAAYTDTATLQTQLSYVETTYLSDPNYELVGGLPLVSFFDTVAGTNYATAKAGMGVSTYWMFENASSLTNSFADACFDWIHAYLSGVDNSDPYNLDAVNNFLSTVHSSSKGSMLCLCPGFDGYLTNDVSWSKGKYLQRDSGKCWLSMADTLNANIPVNCIGIQVATWNDYEEGSEIELGIENDISVTATLSARTVSFSVSGGTGDESTLSSFKLLASPDGVNAANLGTVATGSGVHTFNLDSVTGWAPGVTYVIYVVALGKGSIRNHYAIASDGSSSGGSGGTGFTERLINGDFELGNFTGWTAISVGSLSTVISTVAIPFGITPPESGNFSACMISSDAGVLGPHRSIYQDVRLSTVLPLTLTFWYGLTHAFSRGVCTFQVWDTSNNVLATLFSHDSAISQVGVWTQVSVSLAAFAGQLVRLAFTVTVTVPNVGNVFFSLDNISLLSRDGRQPQIFITC